MIKKIRFSSHRQLLLTILIFSIISLTNCTKSKETKEGVVKIIGEAKRFNIVSTPTMLINGVKIEGGLPLDQIYIILDEILRRAK